ncbi:DUF1571 domain-containing protein [Thalassoglobus polymorphus]|nr:DUF1571 domain-containing protein [Thalassoglobus polymorphus]
MDFMTETLKSATMRRLPNVLQSSLKTIIVCSLFLNSPAFGQEQTKEHPLAPALKMANESLAVLNRVQDYECQFTRREFVNNKLVTQQTLFRMRHQPFSVYLKFIDPAPGREVLYVAGQNQGKLLAHEASGLSSLVGTVSLAVNSPKVMAETRYPITQAGMKNLIQLVIAQWELESKYGEVDVKFYPNAKIGGADCEVVEVSHPRPRKQFPYHLTRVFFEKTTRLPVRVENYGFPAAPGQKAPLLEEYTYTSIKVNNGFKDIDFDRNNPKYSF